MKAEILVFTKEQCKKCDTLISKLMENHIKFREVNIDTKSRYHDYLWELLDKNDYSKKTVVVPLAIIKGVLIYSIDNLEEFVRKL